MNNDKIIIKGARENNRGERQDQRRKRPEYLDQEKVV